MKYTLAQIAGTIDTSLLNPTMPESVLEEGCKTALKYGAGSACVMPYFLKRCAEILKGSNVKASTVIGFPHGGQVTEVKLAEVKQALDDGGQELDVVVNISKVLSGDWDYVRNELKLIVDMVHDRGQKAKVIFENCYYDDAQKKKLCEICSEVKPDWVKTSTGYGTSGATIPDLKLMLEDSPKPIEVKAAGGVRTLDGLIEVLDLGVTRVGSTRTIEFCEEFKERFPENV